MTDIVIKENDSTFGTNKNSLRALDMLAHNDFAVPVDLCCLQTLAAAVHADSSIPPVTTFRAYRKVIIGARQESGVP